MDESMPDGRRGFLKSVARWLAASALVGSAAALLLRKTSRERPATGSDSCTDYAKCADCTDRTGCTLSESPGQHHWNNEG